MSKDNTKQEVRLTRAEKKEINNIIAKYKGYDKKAMSAQQSIPYKRLYPDGICRVDDDFYSKSILFEDIN